MTSIQVTRKYSDFRNIADTMEFGNHEADGQAALETYELPEGYTVAHNNIYDPAGIECALIATEKGMRLMSMTRVGHPDKVIFPK